MKYRRYDIVVFEEAISVTTTNDSLYDIVSFVLKFILVKP